MTDTTTDIDREALAAEYPDRDYFETDEATGCGWISEQRDRAIDATADAALDAHLEAQYDNEIGDSE